MSRHFYWGIVIVCLLFSCFSCNAEKAPMHVMSFNILCDEGPEWDARVDQVTGLIRFNESDIVGMQEVRHNQKVDIMKRLPEYTHVGVGRSDGAEKGEYCSIIFKTDRFELLDSGTFWLSEDINAVGKKGWDAAYERIATWALLKDRKNGKSFLMMNTHLDHMGQVACREGAKLLVEKSAELSKGLPIIMTGDFNAVKADEPIQVLIDKNNPEAFKDSKELAKLWYGPKWTFHGGLDQLESYEGLSVIDYIFMKGNISVLKEGVLSETLNGRYPSDHCPLLGTFLIE